MNTIYNILISVILVVIICILIFKIKTSVEKPEPEPEPETEPETETEPDELSIPNQAHLPLHPGAKYIAQGPSLCDHLGSQDFGIFQVLMTLIQHR